jgi:hypothetical protein
VQTRLIHRQRVCRISVGHVTRVSRSNGRGVKVTTPTQSHIANSSSGLAIERQEPITTICSREGAGPHPVQANAAVEGFAAYGSAKAACPPKRRGPSTK